MCLGVVWNNLGYVWALFLDQALFLDLINNLGCAWALFLALKGPLMGVFSARKAD